MTFLRTSRDQSDVIGRYLKAPEGRKAAAAIRSGALPREVGIEKDWWSEEIAKHLISKSPVVVAGVRKAFRTLREGGVGEEGTHRVGRADLLARSKRLSPGQELVELFALTMMWGSGQSGSRGPRRLASALNDPTVLGSLSTISSLVRGGRLEEAAIAAAGSSHLAGIGQPYFTQWMWACSLGSKRKSAYILNRTIMQTLRQLNVTFGSGSRDYADYVRLLDEVARDLSKRYPTITGEHIEQLLADRTNSLYGFATRPPPGIQPVDRTALHALQRRVGRSNAVAICDLPTKKFAVYWSAEVEGHIHGAMLLAIKEGARWSVIASFEKWLDEIRALGRQLDAVFEEIPVDDRLHPSPTLLIAGSEEPHPDYPDDPALSVEIFYRTRDGVRLHREFVGEGYFETFPDWTDCWSTFTEAVEDFASWQEFWGW